MSGGMRRSARIRKHYSLPSPQINFKELLEYTPSISVDGSNITESEEFEKFDNQVAGHQFAEGKQSVGILKCKDGTILKAFSNPVDGLRELKFYERLSNTKDPILLQLKKFTCHFYGTRKVMVNGKPTEFIILQDLTEDFKQPCIMDVKIGKRTWDPLASPKKIEKEQRKYEKTKQSLGFCVPGFHVFSLSTGKIQRYDKNYGKKLNKEAIKDAFKIFLNANGEKINNELLLEILTQLRKIQKWAKMQNVIRLYTTSILIVYDAEVLKTKDKRTLSEENMNMQSSSKTKEKTNLWKNETIPTNPTSKLISSHPTEKQILRKTRRSQSFQSYLSIVDHDCKTSLNSFVSTNGDAEKPWCVVKVIDLGHVFPPDEDELDFNYLNGINSLVEIFETFLTSST